MAQFGTSGKNPPWVRTAAGALGQPTQLASPLLVQAAIGGPGVATGHTQSSLQQQQAQQQATSQAVAYNAAGLTALGFSQMGMDQQRENVFLVQNATTLQPGTVLSQPGVAIPTSLASVGTPGLALPASLATAPVATVSYPAPRVLQHTSQFQQAQPLTQPPPQHTSKQRVFTGTVNKLHDNFGFVDDDVFFQITCVKGTMPKVGDRVLVEASYNPNMPFKWNATRIQVLPNQSHIQSQTTSSQGLIRPGLLATNSSVSALGGNTVAGMAPQITLTLSSQPGTTIPPTLAIQQLGQAAQTYNQVPPPVTIHNLAHGSTSLVNRMQGLISTRQRHSSPPPRREREREIRRDERRERERHREREIERERPPPPRKRSRSPRPRSRSPPRRRIRVNPRYVVQIPKVSFDMKEANVIELRKRYSNLYVPSDFFLSSFLWMDAFSLSHPFTWERPYSFHVMNKEVENVLENNAILEPPDVDYAYTAKVMLLSAPTLDDVYQKSCALAEDRNETKENFVHPTRLISFLVGLKNKNEIMAIGGSWSPSLDGPNPDSDPTVLIRTAIRTCKSLTSIDLGACTKWYRFAEINYYRGETVHKGRAVPARVETVVIFLPDVWSCTPTLREWQALTASYKKQLMKKLHEDSPEASENQETEDGAVDTAKKDMAHLSEIDPKSMKIAELRHELEARNLSCKGLKSQLVARLTKALKAEQNREEEADEHPEEEDVEEVEKMDEKESSKKKKDDEDKKKDEKERAVWERRYALPETPSIIVHPSVTAKGGKFDCTTMSLSVLLDYRQEDNKEYSFEVSLFAELFNEMLTRDFGFRIYCALAEIPEKKEIEDKEKEKKKPKEKTDDKDDMDDPDNRKDSGKKDEKKREEEDKEMEEDNDEGDEEEEDEELEEEDDSEKKDKKKEKKKEKERKQERAKTYTFDPYLLLAFVYFDQNHCGYLQDKDLEEMIHMLGLNLSRAQVRKLVQNVTVKERLYYRKLTDRKSSAEQEKCKTNEKVGQIFNEQSMARVEELAEGNNKLTSVKSTSTLHNKVDTNKDPPDVSDTGLVMYNGALLKIGKLFEQLERSEKSRTHAESRLTCLTDELNIAKDAVATSSQSKNKLACQLSECESKLKKLQSEMRLVMEKSQKMENVIVNCHNLMKPVLTLENERVLKVEKTVPCDECGVTGSNRKGTLTELYASVEGHENGDNGQ